jgi:hypothetical protein
LDARTRIIAKEEKCVSRREAKYALPSLEQMVRRVAGGARSDRDCMVGSRRNNLLRSRPLKAEVISVRISNIHLLHAIGRDFWRFHILAARPQVSVCGIHIGATEENCRVIVGGNPHGIRFGRPGVLFVSRVQHQLHVIQPEQRPIESVSSRLGSAHDLEPQQAR